MRIVFVSNYFNHHQKPLADALYKATSGNYWFVETDVVPEFRKNLGYKEMSAPYVVKLTAENKKQIERLIMDADVVQYGEAPISLIKERMDAGKITFRDDERRYKTISRYLKWPVYTYKSLWINKGYLLGASAFAAKDYMLSGMKLSKCFKWGYFPAVKEYGNLDRLIADKGSGNLGLKQGHGVSILWVSRLIGLKHPEAPIYVAKKLKEFGYTFVLNMIGTGPQYKMYKNFIKRQGLDDCVHLLGGMDPQEVREYMEKSEIFLFTSDRNEGWGAVLNESMNSACAVVASHAIGSVPFLIEDGRNGLIFRSCNWNDLYEKVKFLIDNKDRREAICKAAYNTICNTWCAKTASENLVALSEALIAGKENPIKEGPCSSAELLFDNWR